MEPRRREHHYQSKGLGGGWLEPAVLIGCGMLSLRGGWDYEHEVQREGMWVIYEELKFLGEVIVWVLGDICMTFNDDPCLHLTHRQHQIEVCQAEINVVFITLAPLTFYCGGWGGWRVGGVGLGEMRYS